ncbi:MAG: gamma-glutamyl-gamma-aminobutyrate hydrolase family protein [Candidatus Dormibacteria bacterium]
MGVTTYLESAAWGAWSRPAALLPTSYVEAIRQGGGVPILLPPVPDAADALVRHLDGLVLAGGNDIDPASYGARPHPATRNTRPERDAAELALVRAALARTLPVLGICRGMQLLNVARGGDLIQHLPDLVGDERHQPRPGHFAEHPVVPEPGSHLAAVLGAGTEVASCHHQGIGRLGDGLVVGGRAPDGVIEAIEMPGRAFVLGVQWHPEEHAHRDARLFTALVEATRAAAGAPG